MAKPSQKMLDHLKVNLPDLAADLPALVDSFEESYKFNQEPPQSIVDTMFDVFIVGYVRGVVNTQGSLVAPSCGPGPSDRCATCTGKCGK